MKTKEPRLFTSRRVNCWKPPSWFEALGDLDGATRCILQTDDKVYAAKLLIKQGRSQDAIALLQCIGAADLNYRQACSPWRSVPGNRNVFSGDAEIYRSGC